MISHLPLHDSIPAQSCFEINADITAFSAQEIYPDSVWTIYKVNAGEWDTLTMTHTSGNQWTACIPGQMEGSMISYYLHAEDASNRSSSHPYIGAPDPHLFYVKVSQQPNVVVSPDSLLFLTVEDMLNGKTAVVRNFSNQEVMINQVNNTGENPFVWNIDPWNITLPHTILPGDTLNLTVKIALPVVSEADFVCDTLFVNTPSAGNQVLICVDPYLLSGINSMNKTSEVSVFPNPMNNSTSFRLFNEKEAIVSIEIYSMLGELVSVPCQQKRLPQGTHTIAWEGTGFHGDKLPLGIYLYRISQNNKVTTGKISIIR